MTRRTTRYLAGSAAIAFCLITLSLGRASAAGSKPTATMVPSSGLVDGQRTTIHASGFSPHVELQVLECAGTLSSLPTSEKMCEALSLDSTGTTSATGDYVNEPGDPTGDTAGFSVTALPSRLSKTVTIRCGPKDPCVLYIGENYHDFTRPHTFLAMSFAGAPAPAPSKKSDATTTVVVVGAAAILVIGGLVVLGRRQRRRGGAGAPKAPVTRT